MSSRTFVLLMWLISMMGLLFGSWQLGPNRLHRCWHLLASKSHVTHCTFYLFACTVLQWYCTMYHVSHTVIPILGPAKNTSQHRASKQCVIQFTTQMQDYWTRIVIGASWIMRWQDSDDEHKSSRQVNTVYWINSPDTLYSRVDSIVFYAHHIACMYCLQAIAGPPSM